MNAIDEVYTEFPYFNHRRIREMLETDNKVSGINLQICLHSELWLVQNRFELIGGLYGISEDDIEEYLYRYLKNSVSYWKSKSDACVIFVAERVKKMAKSEKFKRLLEKVKEEKTFTVLSYFYCLYL